MAKPSKRLPHGRRTDAATGEPDRQVIVMLENPHRPADVTNVEAELCRQQGRQV